MNTGKIYPSMVMLAGEFSVLVGGSALSVPFGKSDARVRNINDCPRGISTGVEALACYTATPLRFKEDGTVQEVVFDPAQIPNDYRFFLLDSGERIDSGHLVEQFLHMMKDPVFESSIRNEYMVINNKLIEALLRQREADPGLLMRILSDYQFNHFRNMIPSGMIDIWIEGQVSNEYYLKFSGSEVAYMLGIAHQDSMQALEERWKKDIIWIE